MALYTVAGVITKVKLLIEEANDTNVITENELITLTSDAQKWVAAETGCYRDWGTITLLANTNRYAPPSNTSGVLSLFYNYGGDLNYRSLLPVTPEAIPHPPDLSYPYFWFYQGNKICVYPALDPLPSTTTVDVLHGKIPATLTETTESLVIPDEFQIVVPYHVAKVVAIKDDQFLKAEFLTKEIQNLTAQGVAQYGAGRTGAVGQGGSQGTAA